MDLVELKKIVELVEDMGREQKEILFSVLSAERKKEKDAAQEKKSEPVAAKPKPKRKVKRKAKRKAAAKPVAEKPGTESVAEMKEAVEEKPVAAEAVAAETQ